MKRQGHNEVKEPLARKIVQLRDEMLKIGTLQDRRHSFEAQRFERILQATDGRGIGGGAGRAWTSLPCLTLPSGLRPRPHEARCFRQSTFLH